MVLLILQTVFYSVKLHPVQSMLFWEKREIEVGKEEDEGKILNSANFKTVHCEKEGWKHLCKVSQCKVLPGNKVFSFFTSEKKYVSQIILPL
jgi:hypothetical protein